MPPGAVNSDLRWRQYGEDFWVKEYKRFGSIFFNEWLRRGTKAQHSDVYRKIVANLPGNHDLGLGNGIRIPVRNRFNAFLGDGNHIDVIGNHTFVSLDTVSLSAKSQPDPATGRQGAADSSSLNKEIWGPAEDFLTTIKEEKRRAIDRAVRFQNNRIENSLLFHSILDIDDPLVTKSVHEAFTPKVDMPSILFSHIPLYRAAGTPCGPLREHSPPSIPPTEEGEYLDPDPGNAIKVEAGIQYQNVLTPEISNEIIEKVGDVEYAFSGDDHDYCELVHRRYTGRRGGVKEITVKSFSWAMGVRRPGFLMVGLWNPVGRKEKEHFQRSHGKDTDDDDGKEGRQQTIQTHLCLLPDQLGIFIRYAIFGGITLIILFFHTIRTINHNNRHTEQHANGHNILPLSSSSTSREKKPKSDTPPPSPVRKAYHQSSNKNGSAIRPRGYGYPGAETNNFLNDEVLDERWAEIPVGDNRGTGKGFGTRIRILGSEFRRSFLRVGIPVLVWWVWCVGRY